MGGKDNTGKIQAKNRLRLITYGKKIDRRICDAFYLNTEALERKPFNTNTTLL